MNDVNNRQSIFAFFISSVFLSVSFVVVLNCWVYFSLKSIGFSLFLSLISFWWLLKNKQVDYFDVQCLSIPKCVVMPFTTFVHNTILRWTHTRSQSTNESANQPTLQSYFWKSSSFKCKSVCDLWMLASHSVFYLKNMHVKLSISLVWFSRRNKKKKENEKE